MEVPAGLLGVQIASGKQRELLGEAPGRACHDLFSRADTCSPELAHARLLPGICSTAHVCHWGPGHGVG